MDRGRKRMKSRNRILILAITAAACCIGASAQPGPGKGHGGPNGRMMNEETRELLEQVLVARISRDLALDDEQTVLLVRRFAEFRERLGELYRERGRRLRELKQAVRDNTSEENIAALLNELMAIDDRITAARREAMQLSEMDLTAWQRAKLYIFLGDFEGDMRQLLQRARQRFHQRFEEAPLRKPGPENNHGKPGKSPQNTPYEKAEPKAEEEETLPAGE
jgi:Sec-independent protein translocase protein TatA